MNNAPFPFSDPRSTFLLVHGSGTSSHMWAPVQRELALLGRRSYAIDLPGHGLEAQYPVAYQAPQDLEALRMHRSILEDVTLDDNVAALLAPVRAMRAHGPVILVAASLGGMTSTVFANRHPDLVDGLAYISAWACASRANPIEYMSEPEFARSLLPELAGLNIEVDSSPAVGRANYRTADADLLERLKAATMADVDDDRFLAFLNLMQPDESLSVMLANARIRPDVWGRIPHTFVRLLQDRSLPVEMQDRLIREADALTPENPFRVHSLDTSHAGFLFRSAEVARLLIGS
ncbi:alpha/beta fold hydrolase [Microbacterium sp. CIAB417]|uniref:alpha/beta hydrolase n=1 Tax=Microbacterium sp. CIAB417 TaxID=2860287 RepID=UPI001FADB8DE|nr:alpha/beta fold hydrolase [Microbacterium sp. CIAB417]